MHKLLLAVPLMFANVSATEPLPQQPAIPKVLCKSKDGYTAGSAFRITRTLLVTAAHVIHDTCEIDGQPVKLVYKSPKADLAVLEDARPGIILAIDCAGYVAGKTYEATGHARGWDQLTSVKITAAGQSYKDIPTLSMLTGAFTVQPGQSGGPVKDLDTGRVVGVVNTGDWNSGVSGSIELKRTSFCGGREA